jgi:hypothetical protein
MLDREFGDHSSFDLRELVTSAEPKKWSRIPL